MVLQDLNVLRIDIANILNVIAIDHPLIFINVWSFVHFFAGMLIMFLIYKFFKKKSFDYKIYFLLFLLVGYEVLGFILTKTTTLFIPDTPIDVFWDVLIGLFGALVYIIIKKKKITFIN